MPYVCRAVDSSPSPHCLSECVATFLSWRRRLLRLISSREEELEKFLARRQIFRLFSQRFSAETTTRKPPPWCPSQLSFPPPPQGWKKKASTETRLLLTGVETFTHRCCGAGALFSRLPSNTNSNVRTEYFHTYGVFSRHPFPLEKVSSNKRPCCSNPLLARRGQKKFFCAATVGSGGRGRGGFFLLASPPCLVLNK